MGVFSAWRRDSRGAFAPIAALGFTVLIGAAAFGVDIGLVFHEKRRAQAAADLAALSAVQDLSRAEATARQIMVDNRWPADSLQVVPGRYIPDRTRAVDARFVAGASGANSVQITVARKVMLVFGRIMSGQSTASVSAKSTAAQASFISFNIGTGVAALDGGVANAILGKLLGANVSLRAVDYTGLANLSLDAFGFLDALRARLTLNGDSYADILGQSVSVGDLLKTLGSVSPVAGNALSALGSSSDAARTRILLSSLLQLGDLGQVGVGSTGRGPAINAANLLSGIAWLGGGKTQITLDLGLQLPGLTQTTLTLSVGERVQQSGWISTNSTGTTVYSSQVRLLLVSQISAPLSLGKVTLPLYLDLGSGSARLSAASCSATGNRSATLAVQPSLATAAIASVSPSAIVAGASPPDLSTPVALARLPLLSLTGLAQARLGSGSEQMLSFNETDIAQARTRTASATGLVGSLTGSLLGTLQIGVNGLDPLGLLTPLLRTTLSSIAPSVDVIVDAILQTLGLRLGVADVAVDGMRCDRAVLVQ